MTAFAFNVVKINNTVRVGVRAPNFDRREVRSPIGTDGTIHQTSDAVIRAAPMASFSTIAVRSLFSLLGTGDDVPFVALDATDGLELVGMQINNAGPGYASGSVHASRKAPRGALFLDRVSWSPGNPAEAECSAYLFSAAGGTDPVTSAAVSAPTLAVNTEQCALSSCTVTGTSLTRVSSLEVAIAHRCENNDESVCYDAGLPYPILLTQAGVGGQAEVTATIETLDLTTAITASGTVTIVFAVVNALGVGLSAATATITLSNCLVRESVIAGEAGGPARRRLEIRATFNGSTVPCAISVSA